VEQSPKMDKSARRAHFLSDRRSLSVTVRAGFDAAVVQLVDAVVRGGATSVVAAYAPLPGEPGGGGLLPALRAAGVRVLLPVLRADLDLDWAVHDGPLRPGRFGLSDPTGPAADVRDADLVLVPALAVDVAGNRLGKGGGSYDRALARVTAPTIALLYPGERIDALPTEPHDRPVSGAVVGYEPAHLYWTKGMPMPHHWHSKYQSANDGG
jgi:5-formyltetrahydrofolate cyclo-ligase